MQAGSDELHANNNVSDIFHHDLFAVYELSSGVRLQLAVNNVLDTRRHQKLSGARRLGMRAAL